MTVQVEEQVVNVQVRDENVTVIVEQQVTVVEVEAGGSRDALFLRGHALGAGLTNPSIGTALVWDGIAWNPAAIPGLVQQVVGEVPGGTVNGSNVTFTTSHAYVAGTLRIFINGLLQRNFTETSTTSFTLTEAPVSGDDVYVDYLR